MDQPPLSPWSTVVDASEHNAVNTAITRDPMAGEGTPTATPLHQASFPESGAAVPQQGIMVQPVMVGGGKKSPKLPMIIAAILVVSGLVGFGIGVAVGASIEDSFNRLSTVDYTTAIGESGNLTHDDEDGLGEEGWYLLIPGDPKADENNNNIVDACENVNFSVRDENGNDVSDRTAKISCSLDENASDSNLYEEYFDIKNHVIVARLCSTVTDDVGVSEHDCEEGEVLTVSNDAGINMSVVDLDAMYIESGFVEELLTKGAISVTSFGAGCCSACGGLVSLVVGLTRLGGTKPSQQVQFVIQ
jgi:hypothetical protein